MTQSLYWRPTDKKRRVGGPSLKAFLSGYFVNLDTYRTLDSRIVHALQGFMSIANQEDKYAVLELIEGIDTHGEIEVWVE